MQKGPSRGLGSGAEPNRAGDGSTSFAPEAMHPAPEAGEQRTAATGEAAGETEARRAEDRGPPDEGQAEARASRDDEATDAQDAPAYAVGSALTA